ncbi:MAG: asparagine synthase [Burkholderiaceae bacterium]|nr:asparagine synthase [Burkholderiaceae bacterium]
MTSPATLSTRPLTAGKPRFATPAAQAAQRSQDDATAWSLALDGADTAARLRSVQGDFAVALQRPDGSHLLAVDRFARQTLCWRIVDGCLHVAERADELARLAPAAELDLQAVYDYLYFHVIPAPRTGFVGVQRLPAGHWALFRDGRIEVRPYWVPEFNPQAAGGADFGALRDEFRGLLKQAVSRQWDQGKPGCFLSGGTDSSTVAGMLKQVAGQAASYSIGFEAEGYDEMAFARIAAKHFGTEHHEYYVTPDDLVRSIPDVAAHYDQPFGNSSAVPAFYCARMARDDGITRILAGDGGDELFGGNKRYATQRVFGVWDALPGPLRGLLGPALDNPLVGALPLLKKGSSYVRQASVPLPDRLQTYNLLERLGVETVLPPALLQRIDRQSPARQQREVWGQPQRAGALDRQLAFDWRYTLAENDLPKVCGTTTLAGLAVGFPMLDEDLVDFSTRLPTAYKLRGLKLRWFFKEALRGFLPDEIITKKKQGFGLPFGVWAVRHAALNRLASDSLHSLAQRGLVQPGFVQVLLGRHLPEHPGYYGEMVWILMMLEQWLQRHAPRFALGR